MFQGFGLVGVEFVEAARAGCGGGGEPSQDIDFPVSAAGRDGGGVPVPDRLPSPHPYSLGTPTPPTFHP